MEAPALTLGPWASPLHLDTLGLSVDREGLGCTTGSPGCHAQGGSRDPYVPADMGAPPGPVWFCSLEGWLINLLCEENFMTLSSGETHITFSFSKTC